MKPAQPAASASVWPPLVALAAIALGLAFRFYVVSLPIETLTSRYLADDYFYYLNVAHHIASGSGSTFDGGLTRTNGYQPLFLGMLVASFEAGVDKLSAIRIGLAIQAVACAAAALAAHLLMARRGAAWAGALAAGLLSLNLFFVLPTLTGFEMALALAGLLWALWCWETHKPPLVVGGLCGLAALARVDTLVLPLLLAVIMLKRRQARDLIRFGGAALAVVAPWAVWSAVRFGSPFPDSGLVKVQYRGVEAIGRSLTLAFHELPRVVVPGRVVDAAMARGPVVLAAIACVLLLVAIREAVRAPNRGLSAVALCIAAAYASLVDAGEPGALVRYLFPVWAVLVLLCAQSRWVQTWWVVGLCLAAHAADIGVYRRWERTAPVQRTYVSVSQAVANDILGPRLAEGLLIGSFDAGALGYFAPRPIVNLDGLANHDIVQLRRDCRRPRAQCLREYMTGKGVRVLAGGTAFGWTRELPDWRRWERLYESPPLADGSTLVVLRLP